MSDVLARFSCVAIDKVFRQQRDVLSSFSKRRNLNRKNLEPIKQVTTEGSAGYRSIQITIRGGDNTNVNLDGLRSSDPLEFPFLQDSQKRNLRVRRQFADFVQENCSAVGQFKTAESALHGSRESPLL